MNRKFIFKTKLTAILLTLVLALGVSLTAFAASVTPTLVNDNFETSYITNVTEYLKLKVDPDEDGPIIGTRTYYDSDGNPVVTVTVDEEGKYLDFTSANGVTVYYVFVKGGDGGNLYDYTPNGVKSDTGLVSPLNNGGNIPEISHFTFYYKKTAECRSETAWGKGTLIGATKNWSMFFDYSGGTKTVDLIAGKNTKVGTVTIIEEGDKINITFTTTDGWKMSETHLYVGNEPPKTSAPGQLGNTHDPVEKETTDSYSIDYDGGKVYIAAHAKVLLCQ